MKSPSKFATRALVAVAATAAVSLVLVGCAGGGSTSSNAKSLIVGTTDVVTFLDPAGSYDNGSLAVQTQVFPYLFDSPVGSSTPTPDIAQSGKFTTPTTFTVKLKKVGTYTLTPTDDGTHIKLDLEVGVKVPLPGFVLKRVLKGALDTGSKSFKKYVESR